MCEVDCLCENAFSRKHWVHDDIEVGYSKKDQAIVIRFKFFDYDFGPAGENGYLAWCDFAYYDVDQDKFIDFMLVETNDQKKENWSWLKMSKLMTSKLQLIGCYEPTNGTFWDYSGATLTIKVAHQGNEARFTIKWHVGEDNWSGYIIRATAKWAVNGIYNDEYFVEHYLIDKPVIINIIDE